MPSRRTTPQTNLRAPANAWTTDRIIDAMRAWAAEQGRPPRSYEWAPAMGRAAGLLGSGPARWEVEHPRWPSAAVVADRFGTFCNGLRAADLPARIPDHDLPRPERVAVAKRLRAAGASLSVIADAVGISLDTARRYVRAHPCAECGGPVVAGGELCQPCSLRARAERAFTRDDAIAAIRVWAAETGEPPRFRQWQAEQRGGAPKWTAEYPRFPSASQVADLLGSWENAQRAAGFTPRRRRWTKDAVIEALRRDAQRRGRPPFYAEWQGATDETPDTSTAVATFGTWRAGLAAAGLRR